MPFHLETDVSAAVAKAAAFRGMSPAQYVQDVVTIATKLDVELAASLKEAEDDFAAGRFYTQEEVEAMFSVRREQRSVA